MCQIKFNTIGRVLKGDSPESFVMVLDDKKNTGGFLILISKDETFETGYDDWVESADALKGYFEESGWIIDWQ